MARTVDSSEDELIHALNKAKKYYREIEFWWAMLDLQAKKMKWQHCLTFDYQVSYALYKAGISWERDGFSTWADHKTNWKLAQHYKKDDHADIANWLQEAVKEQCPEIEEELNIEEELKV